MLPFARSAPSALALSFVALTACSSPSSSNHSPDANDPAADLAPPADLARAPDAKGAIGDACTRASDCESNFCLIYPTLVGGYCSRKCQTDADCGEDWCVSGQYCLKNCAHSPCREGYACRVQGTFCDAPITKFMDPSTLCDPTRTDNPNCTAGQICKRFDHSDDGSGVDKGACVDLCTLGAGTCGVDERCDVFANAAVPMRGDTHFYAGDRGVGATCQYIKPELLVDHAPSAVCQINFSGEDRLHAFACEPGAQCALQSNDLVLSGLGQPLVAGGDNACHVLCYRDGTGPISPPDASPAPGTPFTACPAGTACTDAFGSFDNTHGLPQVGLCR